MITLTADNRLLNSGVRFAFLTNNYSAGVSTLNLTSVSGFNVDDIILVGEFGQETAEIFRIASVSPSGDIVLHKTDGEGASTIYGHAESTKVYQLPYNQVRFYWTAATGTIADENPVFGVADPLSGYIDVDPTSYYSSYSDDTQSTGFGWFVFYNSVEFITSQNSNPIPYAGFDSNTVESVFADFDSLLNVSELKLVKLSDKFAWLNEALAILKNKLNLTNVEYTVMPPVTVTVIGGTQEYLLPPDFGQMISVVDPSDNFSPRNIPFLPVYKIDSYNGFDTCYYLRNRYIGFTPSPSTAAVYQFRYRAKSSAVTSLSDYIDLPDNAFYALKDWMMYRSCLKFTNPAAQTYYQGFNNSVNLFMQAAVKRDANRDSWDIAPTANA